MSSFYKYDYDHRVKLQQLEQLQSELHKLWQPTDDWLLNVDKQGQVQASIREIESDLLEYRRKHEFFDLGDKIVIPKENKLAKFNESYMDIYVVDDCFMDHGVDFISFTCKGKIYTYATGAFKHATDEEIKNNQRGS